MKEALKGYHNNKDKTSGNPRLTHITSLGHLRNKSSSLSQIRSEEAEILTFRARACACACASKWYY